MIVFMSTMSIAMVTSDVTTFVIVWLLFTLLQKGEVVASWHSLFLWMVITNEATSRYIVSLFSPHCHHRSFDMHFLFAS